MERVPQIEVPAPDLLERYGISGPRYTSYPTALSFSDDVGDRALQAAVHATNEALIPPSLAVYVHIPFCQTLCYYCGCNKKVTRSEATVRGYLTALHDEIAHKGRWFDADREVRQIHWGGGTPTFLNAGQRAALMACVERAFNLAPEAMRDFSIEIDPRTLTPAEMPGLVALGFNRISIGVQDFQPQVQDAVNRVVAPGAIEALVVAAREADVKDVGFDLIYGLPYQTEESFRATLRQVAEIQPDTISVFNYAHLPRRFPAQRLLPADQMPAADERIRIFRATVGMLQDAGYEFIGMDHFARRDSHLVKARQDGDLHRCFQGYVSGAGNDTVAFGASAISCIGGHYFQNATGIPAYVQGVNDSGSATSRGYLMEAEDECIAFVIQQIMCEARCDKVMWQRLFRQEFDGYFADALERLAPLVDDGLVTAGTHAIEVTPLGVVFLRTIAQCFDRKLASVQQGFSRTI